MQNSHDCQCQSCQWLLWAHPQYSQVLRPGKGAEEWKENAGRQSDARSSKYNHHSFEESQTGEHCSRLKLYEEERFCESRCSKTEFLPIAAFSPQNSKPGPALGQTEPEHQIHSEYDFKYDLHHSVPNRKAASGLERIQSIPLAWTSASMRSAIAIPNWGTESRRVESGARRLSKLHPYGGRELAELPQTTHWR